jgi:predicted dehydrogenase
MNLPPNVSYRPRQRLLIAKDKEAVIRVATRPSYIDNARYSDPMNHDFKDAVEPYLHGDWSDFDNVFNLDRRVGKQENKDADEPLVVYDRIEHRVNPQTDPELLKLPNITVIRNIAAVESHGSVRPLVVLGCTMGHDHPALPFGHQVKEVYEFQSFGMLVLDREEGDLEMWIAQDGDKVAVPSGCHATIYNLGDEDNPLVTLDFSALPRNYIQDHKEFSAEYGPPLLAYYDDLQVVFTVNRLYVNNPLHAAGVRLTYQLQKKADREVVVSRRERVELGELLYEQLTQNPTMVGRFAQLGIRIKKATPEAVLETVPTTTGHHPLYFSRPLVNAAQLGTETYRYFFPKIPAAKPSHPISGVFTAVETAEHEGAEPGAGTAVGLGRPLVILVEGGGDWVEKTFRALFAKKSETHPLSVFYADDTSWTNGERPRWAETGPANRVDDGVIYMRPWETYLDKNDPEQYARYRLLRPDVVFVVTPDRTHSSIAREWLGKSPLIFVEKPFDSRVKHVDELRYARQDVSVTHVHGLDHYQAYARPVYKMRSVIQQHLGEFLAGVKFYLTEQRPIEKKRTRSLQYGLTLDLLPHLIALLTYFGKVKTIDEIRVLEAGQYEPLISGTPEEPTDISGEYRGETFSRVQFTFEDKSGNGYFVPCLAVVGKGFSDDVKYMEVTGDNGNAIRIDLLSPERELSERNPAYPFSSVMFLQNERTDPLPLTGKPTEVMDLPDPYRDGTTLRAVRLVGSDKPLSSLLERTRYETLMDDLLNGTTHAGPSTLKLMEGWDIVHALDRIWTAIERLPWTRHRLGKLHPVSWEDEQ